MYAKICYMPIDCNMLCFRHSAYVVKADVIATWHVIAIFSCHIVAYRADVRPISIII